LGLEPKKLGAPGRAFRVFGSLCGEAAQDFLILDFFLCFSLFVLRFISLWREFRRIGDAFWPKFGQNGKSGAENLFNYAVLLIIFYDQEETRLARRSRLARRRARGRALAKEGHMTFPAERFKSHRHDRML
jgi:hypothetical protein